MSDSLPQSGISRDKKSPRSFVREGVRRTRQPRMIQLPDDRLTLLSFNIQAGIATTRFSDYFTGSWKHLVAHRGSIGTIEQIAEVLKQYDVVALQEVDGGSLRSRFLNQVVHLASLGNFPFWHQQLNRNLGHLGQFSNGLLSRLVPYHVEDHRLPGLPGRGAFVVKYGHPDNPLVVVGVHLALGEKYRNAQLAYLRDVLSRYRHVVVMGDFNCLPEDLINSPFSELELRLMEADQGTYPSWSPDKHIDHILVSPTLQASQHQVLMDCVLSDHLPVATEILIPEDVRQASAEGLILPE